MRGALRGRGGLGCSKQVDVMDLLWVAEGASSATGFSDTFQFSRCELSLHPLA